MKYIKTYEDNSHIEYEIGDYVRFSDDILEKNPTLRYIINCLEVMKKPHYGETYGNDKKVDVKYVDSSGEIGISYLYLSQIGGYATQESIEEYETYISSKKYNL